MMTFETEEDIRRETKAIERFVSIFNGNFQKLDKYDIDFKIFDSDNKLIAYAEVKGVLKSMSTAYPLPISARKVVKLMDKRLSPVIVWSCDDGIIYGKVKELTGEVRYGGRTPRKGSANDEEIMIYYPKQKGLKYLRFV